MKNLTFIGLEYESSPGAQWDSELSMLGRGQEGGAPAVVMRLGEEGGPRLSNEVISHPSSRWAKLDGRLWLEILPEPFSWVLIASPLAGIAPGEPTEILAWSHSAGTAVGTSKSTLIKEQNCYLEM